MGYYNDRPKRLSSGIVICLQWRLIHRQIDRQTGAFHESCPSKNFSLFQPRSPCIHSTQLSPLLHSDCYLLSR